MVPIPLDLLVQAIGIDRQINISIEGVNRYRYAIPQPIDIPIGILNRLLSRVIHIALSVDKMKYNRGRTSSAAVKPTGLMEARGTVIFCCAFALRCLMGGGRTCHTHVMHSLLLDEVPGTCY